MVDHPAADAELAACRRRIAELEARLAEQQAGHERMLARYEALFEYAPMGYQSLDEAGNLLEVNATWLATLGYSAEEVLGRNFSEFLHPDWKAHFQENFPRFKALGEVLGVEFEMRCKDGSYLPVAFNGRIRRDATGNFVQTHCIFENLSHSRHAEAALRESEARYRQVVNTMRETLSVITPEGDFLFVNAHAAANLSGGLGPDAVLGRNIRDFTPAAQAARLLDLYRQVVQSQSPHTEEVRVEVAAGEKWFHNTMLPIRYGREGRQCILSMSLDITARKQAQQELRQALDRLSFHVENSPLGVVEWEQGQRITFWSPQAEAIFGWTAAEVLEMNWADFPFVHPDDLAGVTETLRRLFQGEESSNTHHNRNFRKDGRVIHCQWYNSVLRDASGNVVSLLSQVADVTALHDALDNLAQARELAESASRAKSAFLANMSHEIRTPLNGLLGMLQLLQVEALSPLQHEYVDLAITAGRRLTRLLSDILDISKIEAGKLPILDEPFDLPAAMEQVAELFLPTARHNGLALNLSADPALPQWVRGDACRLQQVLINLVGNALKFTITGQVNIHAALLPDTPDGRLRVLFSVEDTGCGIPESILTQLFEPFSQVAQGVQRAHQGAGLGLSICKRLVALMDGDMGVESTVGQGSTFYFSVCLGRATPQQAHVPFLPNEVISRCRRILLAEDEAVSRIAAAGLLEREGFEVIAVENGRQALDTLQRDAVDLILMDVQMPEMNGVEATQAIRRGAAGAGNASIPIIAMTAYAMPGDREAFLAAGMDGYIAKPMEQQALFDAIEAGLTRRALGRG
ncbi:PAS domain S-box protein [Megalodesulfovibrio paquesii]